MCKQDYGVNSLSAIAVQQTEQLNIQCKTLQQYE